MAMRPSVAESLFNEIMNHPGHADSIGYLRAMVNADPPTVETEHLDFKSASLGNVPIGDNDIKKAWSEALAGFANTGGGVLIWGIDARKPPGGAVDQAVGFKLVITPHELKARLQQLHHQATDPPIPGVKIEAFPDPTANGHGFVVCYVPESDYKPHRSESANKRWILRAGDSFVDASPSILRSLFFPQRRSYILVRSKANHAININNNPHKPRSLFEFSLHNEGPATAVNLLLRFTKLQKVRYHAPRDWKQTWTHNHWRLIYPEPFHPGDVIRICDGDISFPLGVRNNKVIIQPYPIEFTVQNFSTDQAPQECKLPFSAESILNDEEIVGRPTPI